MRMAQSAGLLRALLRASIVGLVAFAAGVQLASAQTPSQEQIDAFQNLTPEQQRAVLEAMQNGGSATPETVDRPTQPTDQQGGRTPAPVGRDGRPLPQIKEPPRAKPGATVVLTVTANANIPNVEERQRIEGRRDQ